MNADEFEEALDAVRWIGNAITDIDAVSGPDAAGVNVGCLTEAVCGVTAALMQISYAMKEVAEAIRERNDAP